ncbi:hypothetical protein ACF0H2_07000 [Serratia marcescens]
MSKLPSGDANSAPLAHQLQQQLPPLDLTINDLTLIPWQRYAGKLQLSSGPTGNVCIIGVRISAPAQLDEKTAADVEPDRGSAQQRTTLHLAGKITIPLDLASLPTQARAGEMQTAYLEKPVLLTCAGNSSRRIDGEREGDVARWRFAVEVSPQAVSIKQGEWRCRTASSR